MFGILFFVLRIIFIAFLVSLGVSIVIVVPLAILSIPYSLWVGHQNTIGKYKELKNESFGRTVKNSFKLYKSWLTRKPPVF